MLLRSSPEAQKATAAAWRKAEEEYCAWVGAHPRPEPEWVEQAEFIRERLQSERSLNEKVRSATHSPRQPEPSNRSD
jgi:hypothetical protein